MTHLSSDDCDELARTLWLETTRRLLDQAADKCPDSTADYNSVAWLYASSPDPRLYNSGRATTLAQAALKIDPKSGATWNTLGLALLRDGQIDQAIEAIEKSRQFPTSDESNDRFWNSMVVLRERPIADLILAGPDSPESRTALNAKNNAGDATPFLRYIAVRYGSYPVVWLCLCDQGAFAVLFVRLNLSKLQLVRNAINR